MTETSQVLKNPGLLKLELMMRGVRLPEEVRSKLSAEAFGVTGHALFGSAGDMDLVLPGDTWASVPIDRGIVETSPYTLVEQSDGYGIAAEGSGVAATPVRVRRPSHFFEHVTSTGLPFGRVGTVHGPYLALSPTNRCSFLNDRDRCRFCGVGEAVATHDAVPVDDILEAIRIARGEHPVPLVYLSVGHLATDDGGVRFLEPYVAAIKKHFDILIAVDALPPRSNGWIDRTYGIGVDAVSYNLEIFDPDRFATVCPGPAREVGRERFLEALAYAATVFPSGAVACHLIVGLEKITCTHAGIDALTSMGVLPVLPVYRPFKGRDMRRDSDVELFPPTVEQLVDLYTHLWRTVQKAGIHLHLVRDIAIVTTPLEGRFFARDEGFFSALHHRIMGSSVGRRSHALMSDLRRALRVRTVTAPQSPVDPAETG